MSLCKSTFCSNSWKSKFLKDIISLMVFQVNSRCRCSLNVAMLYRKTPLTVWQKSWPRSCSGTDSQPQRLISIGGSACLLFFCALIVFTNWVLGCMEKCVCGERLDPVNPLMTDDVISCGGSTCCRGSNITSLFFVWLACPVIIYVVGSLSFSGWIARGIRPTHFKVPRLKTRWSQNHPSIIGLMWGGCVSLFC